MTAEQKAAYVMAMAAQLNARVAGMQAENNQRVMNGHAPAYSDKAFCDLVDELGCHHNAILELFAN